MPRSHTDLMKRSGVLRRDSDGECSERGRRRVTDSSQSPVEPSPVPVGVVAGESVPAGAGAVRLASTTPASAYRKMGERNRTRERGFSKVLLPSLTSREVRNGTTKHAEYEKTKF